MAISTRPSSRYMLNKTKYLLPPEVEKLRSLIEDHQLRDPRNCFLLSLGLRTGARASELLLTQKSDLNSYDESIFVRGIKGSNDREIPLHSQFFGFFTVGRKPRLEIDCFRSATTAFTKFGTCIAPSTKNFILCGILLRLSFTKRPATSG